MRLLLSSSVLTGVAIAQLSKPVINPPFEGGGLNSLHTGLEANLPLAKYTWEHWTSDRIPEACRQIAEAAAVTGHSAKDIHAFSIQYEDCPENGISAATRSRPSPPSA
ncbi:hypothetical protein NQ176_g4125 [Zarea fungicola]|uniref:Uncharacterized protein n=1 Tax=Zarea fungicola TaxID=93591 RepID=A0ACC1NEX8_9HYPO|nr:hypothetical protein NQ176_g4125 [Lecanicillium fungicola]